MRSGIGRNQVLSWSRTLLQSLSAMPLTTVLSLSCRKHCIAGTGRWSLSGVVEWSIVYYCIPMCIENHLLWYIHSTHSLLSIYPFGSLGYSPRSSWLWLITCRVQVWLLTIEYSWFLSLSSPIPLPSSRLFYIVQYTSLYRTCVCTFVVNY